MIYYVIQINIVRIEVANVTLALQRLDTMDFHVINSLCGSKTHPILGHVMNMLLLKMLI